MLKPYNTIIWDWNGTLLNDIDLCIDIANKLLSDQNKTSLDKQQYKSSFGFPITDYYTKIGIDMQQESFELLTKKFITQYTEEVKNCGLHHKAEEVLETFRTRNWSQYILTAAHKDSVLSLLDFHGIDSYFEEVEGLDNHRAETKVYRGKELLKNNNIVRTQAVLIGDTLHDHEVAQEIGVDCILIANGHQSKERLEDESKGKVMVLDFIHDLIG
ncbi:MAG: HAD family hydrolase [Aureispira sp.]|nr:HAD family hydrolase [Aureispira sp.]